MIIEHNHVNEEKMTQGCGGKHGIIYVSIDLPVEGVRTYRWDIYGDDASDMRYHTREVKEWAHHKAHSAGDAPYRIEVR